MEETREEATQSGKSQLAAENRLNINRYLLQLRDIQKFNPA